jgi:hypothetical protein
MPLGTVTQVSPGPELFLNIRVKPAAPISRLEEVLVITKVVENVPSAAEAPTGPVRAADVLAQRLPTVVARPPDPDASKNETNIPLSMAEWIRRQKQAQQQKGTPTTSGGPTRNPAGGAPPSAASASTPPKSVATPNASSTSPSNSVVPAPRKQPTVAGEANATQTNPPAAAPKKAAPKKQPDTTVPPKPADQPPATPPGVTL